MVVFRVERNKGYTSNYHLKDKRLTLKSKGLLSMMLSQQHTSKGQGLPFPVIVQASIYRSNLLPNIL